MTAAEDRENRRAVASLARRLRERDEALKDGADVPDWEPFAAEFIAAMRGQGWRWSETHAPHRQRPAGHLDPDVRAEALARAAAATSRIFANDPSRQEAGTPAQEGARHGATHDR